ncbi:CreA family protein [Maritalea porphyrae]|uniref:CreA family protein n=2 Tax=Maritalea TaxID=623276 RepID=UPI0022B022AA|nr:CreA family protein [Maritalea porphyrae]MCZ4273804.1 CreA family protein [Maritalea porphyrae]
MKKILAATALISASLMATFAQAEEVGKIGVDWVGNDILIEAVHDHEIEGVTCHLAYFDRGFFDRLSKGNWFEDPSNSSIACRVTGPVTVGDIDLDKNGEEVFKEGRSFLWKKLVVKRIYDKANNSLIYLSHTREVSEGSAKMSISTVPLYGVDVTWSDKYWPNGKPE